MLTMLELKESELSSVVSLAKEYNGRFPKEFEFPSIVTLRLNNVETVIGTVNADITFNANMETKLMDIHYSPIGYNLSREKRVPPFDMKVRLGKDFFDRVSFVEMPKDMLTYLWLIKKVGVSKFDGTHSEFIVFLCHCAGMALGAFPFALDSTIKGNKIVYTGKPDFYNVAKKGIERLEREVITEERLEGWDCVSVKWEQFWKIHDSVENVDFSDAFDHIAMTRFAVKFSEDTKNADNLFDYSLYFFEVFPDSMSFNVSFTTSHKIRYHSEKYRVRFWKDYNPITGESKLVWALDDSIKYDDECYKNLTDPCGTPTETYDDEWSTIDFIVHMFLNINHFMVNYKDVAMDVEERECKHQSTGSKKHNHNRRGAVRMFKTYTLKKAWKTAVKKRNHEIHCLAWGVKGHFRHYKSGKVIFISPYIKGKEKDKYQGKDYILPPSEVI